MMVVLGSVVEGSWCWLMDYFLFMMADTGLQHISLMP